MLTQEHTTPWNPPRDKEGSNQSHQKPGPTHRKHDRSTVKPHPDSPQAKLTLQHIYLVKDKNWRVRGNLTLRKTLIYSSRLNLVAMHIWVIKL